MRLRRTHRGWAETAPAACPACRHRWGPHQLLVGVAHCDCGLHRTWTCRGCGETAYEPPLSPACTPQALDGRPG